MPPRGLASDATPAVPDAPVANAILVVANATSATPIACSAMAKPARAGSVIADTQFIVLL
ncbi:hypothetical protein RN2511_017000 [Rhodococcus sp. NKCM2511]|nr:hypothetical protein RN2511_017000 [Rhodococcus sp. NKCM2511]